MYWNKCLLRCWRGHICYSQRFLSLSWGPYSDARTSILSCASSVEKPGMKMHCACVFQGFCLCLCFLTRWVTYGFPSGLYNLKSSQLFINWSKCRASISYINEHINGVLFGGRWLLIHKIAFFKGPIFSDWKIFPLNSLEERTTQGVDLLLNRCLSHCLMLYFMVHIHHPFWFLNLHPILFEHLVFFLFCVCKGIICLGEVFLLVMLLIPEGAWIIGRRAGLVRLNGKRFARLFHFLININLFLPWLHLLAAFDINLLMLRTALAQEIVLWTIDLYTDVKVN